MLKLALTHRSYLSVTGQGPRESNERLEFLGDSVLGLVTSEYLYRAHPTEHEGQLTKTKSLLVSKAILSRRALAMGLGRFVLMSHSEIESGGRQRLSILADAFESVVGAIYLDQGFEASREFISRWLLKESKEIVADKRHTNFKSHLQEYVQSTYRTHPVYRIRSEMGPDHSKQFNVEVMVGKRVLGSGRGANKKEAEQAAARNALEGVEAPRAERLARERSPEPAAGGGSVAIRRNSEEDEDEDEEDSDAEVRRGRRGRRGGRARSREETESESAPAGLGPDRPEIASRAPESRTVPRPAASVPRPTPPAPKPSFAPSPPAPRRPEPVAVPFETRARVDEDEFDEIGRPEGPLEERHVDPYGFETAPSDVRVAGEARPPVESRAAGERPIAVESRAPRPARDREETAREWDEGSGNVSAGGESRAFTGSRESDEHEADTDGPRSSADDESESDTRDTPQALPSPPSFGRRGSRKRP